MKNAIRISSFLFLLFGFCLPTEAFHSWTASAGKTEMNAVESEALVCDAPTGMYTTNISQNTATFNWSAVPGAMSYSVQTRLPNGTWSFVPGSPFTNTYVDASGFNSGTTYEWRVATNCIGGEQSFWTQSVVFTTSGSSSCTAPTWLETFNITQTTATWDWSPVSGAWSYSVQWRYAGGTWNNLSGGPWTNTVLNVGGLLPNTAYEWRVRSNCANGVVSEWSIPDAFTTLGSSCAVPGGTYTTNITETSAVFNWSPVSGAVSYSVQTRLPNGTWSFVPGSPFSGTSAFVNWFAPGTTYEWRVRANCGNGNYSYWSSPVTFTTLGSFSCVAPDWLGTLNITSTTATWDWSPASGAISYSVQWRYLGGSTWYNLPGGPWTNTQLNIGGLQPGTSYEWRVRSNCANWATSDWSYSVSFTTLGTTCTTPSQTWTTDITQSSAVFNWSPVSGAVSYTVQTRLPNGTWSTVPGSPFTGTSAFVNWFNPGTTYEWRVRANCSYGSYSNWSYPVTFTTLGSITCDAPSWLGTLNITQTSATWDWSPAAGAISYSVQWRYAGGSTWYNLAGGPFTNTQVNVGGLQPATSYEWRVRSNCSNWSTSAWSYPTGFTTLGNTCATPTGTYTSNITSDGATLHWDDVPGAESYSVQIRLPWGSWTSLTGSPFYDNWVTVNWLSPGTTYEWRVRANCSYGNYSNWTYPLTFTPLGSSSCTAPDWLSTVNITSTTATWDWSSVAGAQSYSVQWRYAGGTWYNLAGGPWTNTILNVGGLLPNTAYEWRVRSNCYGNSSDWSYPDSFTTLGGSCSTPTGTYTSNITENGATFNWNAVSGAVNYSVQTRLPNGTWSYIPGSPVSSTWVIVNWLNPGTTYEWRVRANCSNGDESYWTTPLSFTTLGSNSGAANDNCSNATVLSVGTTCTYTMSTNMNATPSMPSPVGNCFENNYKDVWFKFTMPNVSNPTATIRTDAGSLNDAVMEVYVGSSCANLTYLTCEDENLNGNGSSMPVINIVGYANQTIWVRVWGYNGAMGTFSICVFDYISTNSVMTVDENTDAPVSEDIVETALADEDAKEMPVALVSPNPASDHLTVRFAQKDIKVTGMVMTDMSGKIMLKKQFDISTLTDFEDELNVADFAPGIYLLQIVTTNGVVTEKVSVID